MKRFIFIFLFSYVILEDKVHTGKFKEDMKITVNKEQGGCFCIDMSELSSNIDFYAIFESTDGIIDKKIFYRFVESCDIACIPDDKENPNEQVNKLEEKKYEYNIKDENRNGKYFFLRYTGFNGTNLDFIMKSVSSNAVIIGVGIFVTILVIGIIATICICYWKKVYKKKKEEMDENLQPSFVDTEKDKDKDKDEALLN